MDNIAYKLVTEWPAVPEQLKQRFEQFRKLKQDLVLAQVEAKRIGDFATFFDARSQLACLIRNHDHLVRIVATCYPPLHFIVSDPSPLHSGGVR